MLPLTPVSSGRPARLATRRLLLRWLTAEHVEALRPLCGGDLDALVGHASVFVLTGRTDPAAVGLVRLSELRLVAGEVDVRLEVGLLPVQRGQGLGAEALVAVADWAADELGSTRVVVLLPPGDDACARTAAAAGFTVTSGTVDGCVVVERSGR